MPCAPAFETDVQLHSKLQELHCAILTASLNGERKQRQLFIQQRQRIERILERGRYIRAQAA